MGGGRPLGARARFEVRLAQTKEEVRTAQRLRYRVFSTEMGAEIDAGVPELDADEFDPHCEHLLLIEPKRSEVVGTYRILSQHGASKVGRFYSETEFDLRGVRDLPGLFELGRACVSPNVRTGMAIATLMAGVAQHLRRQQCQYVIGTSSLYVSDDAPEVRSLCSRVVREHPSPPSLRVTPHHPFRADEAPLQRRPHLPGLLRAYLRLGAYVCGEPAWDPAFRTADLLLLLDMQRFDGRFADRLQRAA